MTLSEYRAVIDRLGVEWEAARRAQARQRRRR